MEACAGTGDDDARFGRVLRNVAKVAIWFSLEFRSLVHGTARFLASEVHAKASQELVRWFELVFFASLIVHGVG
jgi:hypothetical protein